jgi:hypothetical protein
MHSGRAQRYAQAPTGAPAPLSSPMPPVEPGDYVDGSLGEPMAQQPTKSPLRPL